MFQLQHTQNTKPGWSLDERDPKFIENIMPILGILYNYYFRVQTSGWENIPEGKVLFVGSHNGGLASPDTSMMLYDWLRRFGTQRPIYGLMHPKVWEVFPPAAEMAMKGGAIMAHPKMAYAAFKAGASVLVYPGGAEDVFRPHQMRDKIYFAERRGFIKLALRENVPIVPAISWGAHDTLIVLADLYKIMQQFHQWGMPWLFDVDPLVFPVYLGLPWGLAVGPLPNIPLPARIHTRVCPPIVFERYGKEAASDRKYVNECYELVRSKMQEELDNLIKEANK
ncbi:lysophospholipid acyltransferase family protein [Sphaerospermopsis kisseleviana CS-549]|jgi:1-acyl-sn-glycerol-3-phosphate acyltransferase|uniref:Phospholipid/glycerol acyltransferase n=3 Tax=Sphaerospermopsis TaxID=752201 RepID=A0A479ZRR3_9CYAN|nr:MULTISPECIES: lysophospholipid acyltransferase family protein [Sphaerospermopsis]BAZ82767.1 phospholipid/glycerol acyltransferase [Sphaerospermopsis kisseleviana NIES-73]MBD2132769.1 acyltransferase family protein [Sphaerospermopsis sp. FACHB-1094]MBD2144776.1 acyltransferase family protein [Sphaerospermopsis sp. FACHB-1194]MBE9235601.1 acyltransferase family protein [Sphaerospermopsis aphanizomenoides LEGE 00250]MDB9444278.1 lysophospholipid acyltransferase family protein [Sphaerospermopsi